MLPSSSAKGDEERKRKNREAGKRAKSKKDQRMKDLVNEKASLEKEKLRISELRSKIGEKQKAIDLKKADLSAEKDKYNQYYKLLLLYLQKLGI